MVLKSYLLKSPGINLPATLLGKPVGNVLHPPPLHPPRPSNHLSTQKQLFSSTSRLFCGDENESPTDWRCYKRRKKGLRREKKIKERGKIANGHSQQACSTGTTQKINHVTPSRCPFIMAAALDEEDLSIPLAPSDRDRPRERDRERDRERTSKTASSNPSAMAMPPPSRPTGRPDPTTQSPATMRDMQRLDQYQTVKILGEGSFGKVKLAIHQPSGRQVALKIISRRKLLSRDMVGRVEREIQYLQLLRHPHIIKL